VKRRDTSANEQKLDFFLLKERRKEKKKERKKKRKESEKLSLTRVLSLTTVSIFLLLVPFASLQEPFFFFSAL
jgi:hypothetical protein